MFGLKNFGNIAMKRSFYFIIGIMFFALSADYLIAQTRNIGKEYYLNINRGDIHFINNGNIDSCLYYYEKAFKIGTPFSNDYYQLAEYYLKIRDYASATNYLKKACLLGRNLKERDSSSSFYYVFCSTDYIKTRFYVDYRNSCDSLYSEFKKNLNLDFAYLVQSIFGGDQLIRRLNSNIDYKPYDSLNYVEIFYYINENGFPDFHFLDPETITSFKWLYHHFRNYPDNYLNFKLEKLYYKAFADGLVDNLTLVSALDYFSLNTTGKQLFGSYTKMRNDSTYFEEFLFDNIDSVRAEYSLGPLLLTKIMYEKTILPEKYIYRDYYSK